MRWKTRSRFLRSTERARGLVKIVRRDLIHFYENKYRAIFLAILSMNGPAFGSIKKPNKIGKLSLSRPIKKIASHLDAPSSKFRPHLIKRWQLNPGTARRVHDKICAHARKPFVLQLSQLP